MAGKTISTTVPKNLPNGYYLVRQEVDAAGKIKRFNLTIAYRLLGFTLLTFQAAQNSIPLGKLFAIYRVGPSLLKPSISFQLHIQNSPTGDAPLKVTPTVKFPGAYSANDPGILVDAFSGQPYQFPGGEIATISNSGTARSVKPRHARRTLRWARHRMH
jgi:hypothetical protein